MEGFNLSIKCHELIHGRLIDDEDSGVFNEIRLKVPYGHLVVKIEFANHVTRCFHRSLIKVNEENSSFKGKGILTNSKIRLMV